MPTYKTPDVYIEEISVFPPSVAEVETAIPAFIGYTEKAIRNAAHDLILKPTKIYSLKEYEQYYGYPKDDAIALTVANDPKGGFTASITEPTLKYLMYYSVKMFFDNGGGQCYIISVGIYQAKPAIDLRGDPGTNATTMYGLQDGLEALALEDEPTLIVIPEAVKLTSTEYQTLVQAVLLQCERLRDRFAIFDIYDGENSLDASRLSTNRGYFGNNSLKYGAVYYPFLKTTLNFYVNDGETNVSVTPPAGSDATATATVSVAGVITGIALTSGGTGYTSAPTVVISGGGGTGATATATVSAGVITGITVNSGGTGYTSVPTISFTGGGGAAATATVAAGVITSIAVTSGGAGYTSAPTVVIFGGGGTGATATATVAAGAITGITVNPGGTGYTSAPTISFTGGGGSAATATVSTAGVITGIAVTSGGTGYTSAPTISFTGGGGAVATATVSTAGVITGITINSGGAGYTSAPTVVISGGGGRGATATATVSAAGVITGITVNSGGTGYTSAPTISFTGGGGSAATATVSTAGVITGIAVTSGGTGYTSAPKVVITAAAPVAANLVSLKTPNTALYNFVKTALKEHFVVLPPSGAVAGIYAATDSNRGVWKAPANVSLANVIEPVIKLDNARQDDLNVDATTGKSINAIRAFMGKGTLVWGARTLAGNDNEWRYIPVRRFFSVVEESVKKSTYWAVFEPNDANTWVKVRGSIENYLTQKWREGALAGATPKEAFFVKCGLGITMTAIDILEGRMNVEIGMAVVRPAEFIILKFSHKLQTS